MGLEEDINEIVGREAGEAKDHYELDESDGDISVDDLEFVSVDESGVAEETESPSEVNRKLERDLEESREEYLRLYAEFDNYRKRIARDKEDLSKYANETILYELLPSIDNLEIALKHSAEEANKSFVQGVEMTLREIYRTLEKFGVSQIKSVGEPFNPEFHHAMARIEKADVPENMVVAELRKGYMYHEKVLRPSMVSVSVKPSENPDENNEKHQDD